MRDECGQVHDALLRVLAELSVVLRLPDPEIMRLTGLAAQFLFAIEQRRQVMGSVVYPPLLATVDGADIVRVHKLREQDGVLYARLQDHAKAWPTERIEADRAGFCATLVPLRVSTMVQLFDEQMLLYPLIDRFEQIQVARAKRPCP